MSKNKDIKVSVIIPIFNMQEYIEECIDSVIKQSLHELEIICIDDGSQDNSYDILKEYAKTDNRIKIIKQHNQGVAVARNMGIHEAIGKYVLFMDADDMYPNERVVELLYKTAEENQVVIAGGQFSDMDSLGRINTVYDGMLQGYIFEKEGLLSYREYQFDYGYHRFIYLREFLISNSVFFPEYARYQDPPFMVKAMTVGGIFYALKEVTYCYRMDYKIINWSELKVYGLLRGLQDNLQWARKYNLTSLYNLTMERLVNEYRQVIVEQIAVSAKVVEVMLQLVSSTVKEHDKYDVQKMILEGYEKQKNCRLDEYKEYQRICNSVSYRLGLGITYFPRKVYKSVKYLIHKESMSKE